MSTVELSCIYCSRPFPDPENIPKKHGAPGPQTLTASVRNTSTASALPFYKTPQFKGGLMIVSGALSYLVVLVAVFYVSPAAFGFCWLIYVLANLHTLVEATISECERRGRLLANQ